MLLHQIERTIIHRKKATNSVDILSAQFVAFFQYKVNFTSNTALE